eukprot:8694451-Alexandrium_andersonii.AAC.1
MRRSVHIARGGCASGASHGGPSKGTLLIPECVPVVARGFFLLTGRIELLQCERAASRASQPTGAHASGDG